MHRHSHARLLNFCALLALAGAAVPLKVDAQSTANPNPAVPLDARTRSQRALRFPGSQPSPTSALPATQPTSLPSTPAVATTPAAGSLPAPIAATPLAGEPMSSRPKRAQVTFIDRQLNVRANDSSLNQILRSISRATGLKITGGVQDQRVFGNYGPASTSSVLATLLDGTGTNIVLLEGDVTTPPELILTPRGGGPTPPNPNAPGFDDGTDPEPAPARQQVTQAPARSQTPQSLPAQPQNLQQQGTQQNTPLQNNSSQQQNTPLQNNSSQQQNSQQSNQPQPGLGPSSMPQPLNNVNGSPLNTSPTASTLPTTDSVPTDQLPTPSTTLSSSGIVDAPNPPAPGSTTATNPTGATTPEQVYQQLLKMQQQQQQPTQVAQPSTPNPQ